MRQWGKDMQAQNISSHSLRSRGYLGKEPKWNKQDEEWEAQNVVNPFNKFADPLTKRFIWSHYGVDKVTGSYVMNNTIKLLEKQVVIILPAQLASNHADYLLVVAFLNGSPYLCSLTNNGGNLKAPPRGRC